MATDGGRGPVQWCEISDGESDKVRFQRLSKAMKAAGLENAVDFIETDKEGFGDALKKAEEKSSAIRLSGCASEWIFAQTERLPSLTATLQCADAIAKEETPRGVRWWPRSFLLDGLNRTLAKSKVTPDISGAVFILGARPITRAIVAALAKIGFSSFNIVDPDETKAQELCESLGKRLFGLDIQFIQRHYMTQLPGIHSVGINVLSMGKDDGTLQELYYFNFLKPGGLWLDLPLVPYNSGLEAEAESVGASLLSGPQVLAITDSIWVNECFGIDIDVDALIARFEEARKA